MTTTVSVRASGAQTGAHREQNAVLPLRQFLGLGRITLLLGHLGQVLDGDLVIHEDLHLTGTVQFGNGLLGFDNRKRASIPACINF